MDIYKKISLVVGVRVTKDSFDYKMKQVSSRGGFTIKHMEGIIFLLIKMLGEMEEVKVKTDEPKVDFEALIYELRDKITQVENRLNAPPDDGPIAEEVEEIDKPPKAEVVPEKKKETIAKKVKEKPKPAKKTKPKKQEPKKGKSNEKETNK